VTQTRPFSTRWGRIALIVLAPLIIAGCGINTIPTKEEAAKAQWAEVQNQYQRRSDLIPNLVNTVKGVMEFEKGTLTAVMDARSKAMGAAGPADAARKEGELGQVLGRLLAVTENYPQLKANENVKMLQEELSSTENKIGFARQFYNDIATKMNIARQVFPANLIANNFGFAAAELFQISDDAERAVPAVDLGMKPPA
jgi:LemA protein